MNAEQAALTEHFVRAWTLGEDEGDVEPCLCEGCAFVRAYRAAGAK